MFYHNTFKFIERIEIFIVILHQNKINLSIYIVNFFRILSFHARYDYIVITL